MAVVNPPMDDRCILAEMERRLARDDPEMVSLMDALNSQFPAGRDDDRNGNGERHDWHWKAAVVLTIVAVVAMILTAILTRPPSPDDNKGPPNGLAPAVSVLTQRRVPPRTTWGRRPGSAGMGQLAHPPHARQGTLMRAGDLAESYISVRNDADAVEAVRLLVEQQLPGLLVVDATGQPYAILPACDVVRAVVPGYVQEDAVLAGVIDEPHADHLGRSLLGRTVADCLPGGMPSLPTAAPDSTAMELAELMARTRNPLVAVVQRRGRDPGRLLGVVTATRLLEHLLQAA